MVDRFSKDSSLDFYDWDGLDLDNILDSHEGIIDLDELKDLVNTAAAEDAKRSFYRKQGIELDSDDM